jgi:hypothetical protein
MGPSITVSKNLEISLAWKGNDSGASSSDEGSDKEKREPYTVKELILVYMLLSLPLIFFILLLLFVLVVRKGLLSVEEPAGSSQAELPCDFDSISKYYYYYYYNSDQIISGSQVSLIGSTGFSIAIFVVPWFLILYSYVVARQVDTSQLKKIIDNRDGSNLTHSLLKGTWQDLFVWIEYKRKRPNDMPWNVLDKAVVGLIIALFFS